MKKEQYLGVNVSTLTYDEILDDLRFRIKEGKQSTVIAVNPEKVITANKNPLVKELINESTYQIPDGVGVLLASKLKGGSLKERVTGIDMMERLLRFAADEDYGVFFYGAKEEVVSEAKQKLEERFPTLKIVGYENGYMKDNDKLVEKINASGAKLLFVALGSPKQELWIRENMSRLNVKVFQGVGGSFDVFSGRTK
ncbi:MAG TPA: WecB/TagA/CpsF family glycosyltransferase, partial [Pseudoneobacillus sp.]|nr:WecB/TagA/CpsF family glycosyltransferase [Pseudoneobacillus sp.]